VMTLPSDSARSAKAVPREENALTLEIDLLEKDPVFMVPILAHIHTVWSVQLGEIWRAMFHEVLGFDPGQGQSLFLLGLQSLLVYASPDPLATKKLLTSPPVIWRVRPTFGVSIGVPIGFSIGCAICSVGT